MTTDTPVPHADKIIWKSDDPVWMDQLPLTKEKLMAAKELVQEQLALGHIEPSTSPWNSPIFVIRKKSEKWRLLQDLRAVNKTMHPMGALQPGLPNPMTIPSKYLKIIIDLKDCFYTIRLHPVDCPRFAFSVPSINFDKPMDRYQWKVLPQGMANSPTLCQKFVHNSIKDTRQQYPTVVCVHYMDDILLAAENSSLLEEAFGHMQIQLTKNGLKIAVEKIQRDYPFQYLGFQLYPKHFLPQKISISLNKLSTLNDFQKLLGDINWMRPYLKLTTHDLSPLFQTLEGNPDPSSPRQLTPQAKEALRKVEQAIETARVTYASLTDPWKLIILPTPLAPTGVLYQDGVLYWIHGKHTQSGTLHSYPMLIAERIRTGRHLSIMYLGKEPATIVLPYKPDQLTWLFNVLDDFALAFAGYTGEITNEYPKDKILSFAAYHSITFPSGSRFQQHLQFLLMVPLMVVLY